MQRATSSSRWENREQTTPPVKRWAVEPFTQCPAAKIGGHGPVRPKAGRRPAVNSTKRATLPIWRECSGTRPRLRPCYHRSRPEMVMLRLLILNFSRELIIVLLFSYNASSATVATGHKRHSKENQLFHCRQERITVSRDSSGHPAGFVRYE